MNAVSELTRENLKLKDALIYYEAQFEFMMKASEQNKKDKWLLLPYHFSSIYLNPNPNDDKTNPKTMLKMLISCFAFYKSFFLLNSRAPLSYQHIYNITLK